MNELATRDRSALSPATSIEPLTAKQLEARLARIHEVMKNVMKPGVDYGVIPGTEKPTLFKPGAEKLVITFMMTAGDPVVTEVVDEKDAEIRYRMRVPISAATGQLLAVGVGECSSLEEKYKWRRPVHIKEYEDAPVDRKRRKYTRKGDVWEQVRVEPADVGNTILKMAHKRAYIHAAIMATGASSIFTQDVEDLPDGMEHVEDHDQRREPPQSRAQQSSQAAATSSAGAPTISEPQDKRLFAIASAAGVAIDDVKAWLAKRYPYTTGQTNQIRRADYDAIIDAVRGGLDG